MFDQDEEVTSAPCSLVVGVVRHGYGCKQPLGRTPADRLELLKEDHIGVVESAVDAIVAIGDPEGLEALRALRHRIRYQDANRLRKYYARHVYTPEARREHPGLPPPNERIRCSAIHRVRKAGKSRFAILDLRERQWRN